MADDAIYNHAVEELFSTNDRTIRGMDSIPVKSHLNSDLSSLLLTNYGECLWRDDLVVKNFETSTDHRVSLTTKVAGT